MRLLYQKGLLCGNDMVCCNQRLQEKWDRVRVELGQRKQTFEMHYLVEIRETGAPWPSWEDYMKPLPYEITTQRHRNGGKEHNPPAELCCVGAVHREHRGSPPLDWTQLKAQTVVCAYVLKLDGWSPCSWAQLQVLQLLYFLKRFCYIATILHCESSYSELWSEDCWWLLWWQLENPLVDTSGGGGGRVAV